MTKSFILYQEYKENLSVLSQKQKGDLLDAIFAFNEDKEIKLEPLVDMAFSFIKSDLQRNKKKYENIAERNRINGAKGGRPSKAKKPSGLIGNPKKPRESLNDNVNDNDNDNDNKKKEDPQKIFHEAVGKQINQLGIDPDTWDSFMEVRKNLKVTETERATNMLLSKLTKMKDKGHDVKEVIEESVINNWKGVFEPKKQFNQSNQSTNSAIDRVVKEMEADNGIKSIF